MSTLRFDRTWSLPEDPASTRARALDVDTRRASFADDGGRDVVVAVQRGTDADVLTCTRTISTGARGVGAALIGTTMALEQTERWDDPDDDGPVTARLEVRFPGRPLHLDARIDIRRTATGCDYRVSGVAEARMPGVGGLVARQIVDRTLADLGRHLTLDPTGPTSPTRPTTVRPRPHPAASGGDDPAGS